MPRYVLKVELTFDARDDEIAEEAVHEIEDDLSPRGDMAYDMPVLIEYHGVKILSFEKR